MRLDHELDAVVELMFENSHCHDLVDMTRAAGSLKIL